MNQFLRSSALFGFGILFVTLVGCGLDSANTEAKAPNRKDLPSFKEGKGLLLPEETRRFIGLEIGDVADRKVNRSVTLEVQVYEADSGKARYASGLVDVAESEWLHPGQPVSLVSKDGKIISGILARLETQAQLLSRQAEVIIEIPRTAPERALESNLTATLTATNAEEATTIPVSALLRAAAGDFVYVVNGERLLRTAVTVGNEGDGFVQIKEGLYAGDKVVVKPPQTLWLTELRLARAGGDTD